MVASPLVADEVDEVVVTSSPVVVAEAVAVDEVVGTTTLMPLSATAVGSEESHVQKRVSWNEGHKICAAATAQTTLNHP